VFDLGWSKLIIIAMLAIVVVGPKDLPALLRTIGKFIGQIRRQADEFRRQFDDAMRDTELDQIRKDVEGIKQTAEESVRDIGRSAEDSVKPLQTAASDITAISNNSAPVSDAASNVLGAIEAAPSNSISGPANPAAAASAPSLTKAGA
jgi:sec-independent protein translocase protein TatB